MGGRGSNSKLGYSGKGGVGGVPGGGAGGSGVDGSGRVGGTSAGGNPNHLEAGPGGQTLNKGDQRGGQETNGMSSGMMKAKKDPREHIDGNDLTDEEKVTQAMLDTGWSEPKAQAFVDVVSYYSDGNSKEFCGSADKANYMFGDRPDDSKLISEGIMAMPPYEGELWRGITISAGAAEEWFDEMHTGDVFGFAGYYTGKDMADSFSHWVPADMRDAGVLASFTSDRGVALRDYAHLKVNDNGTIVGDRGGKNTNNTTIIFHLTGNKTASSITHLAISGADEKEVLSPIWQQFEYGGKTLIRVLPNGHEVYQVELIDKGVKPKDRGPVR